MKIQINKIRYTLPASYFKEKLIFNDFSVAISYDNHSPITKLSVPNNYGKTSILKLISGLVKPISGEIVISSDINKIIYIPTLPATFNFATVQQNIEHILSFSDVNLTDVTEKYKTLIALSDLAGYESHRPDPLSFGFRFRIMIIASLLAGADCILLDDIYSNLDSVTSNELKEFVVTIAQNYKVWFIEV